MNFSRAIIQAALAEDIGAGDVTSLCTIPAEAQAEAIMVARQDLVVCGLDLVEAVFRELAPEAQIERRAADAQSVAGGQPLLRVRAGARAILAGERVALNFAQRLSGIATLTAKYVAAIAGTKTRILDTRKTTPGWRLLEKYAVACGGGVNHRFGLNDRILVKDNHLAALRDEKPNAVAAAARRARAMYPNLELEIEADTVAQAEQAAAAGVDVVLLDNMSNEQLRAAVQIVAGRARTEASGGVNLANVRGIAETGVDFISVGALTHSAPAVDIGLDFPG
ncbi:MAG TPA: carboxylating nicotinate-nucleotide diphosphorylase [Verrucomicrobiae bacterium]|jgi:nicotinate-nucleotide pyrophosphorylase (carboxylating)|nr:carboxylating nicotinate-nucleotide diphosphorylase [Verrucomicrobiae bacterium]